VPRTWCSLLLAFAFLALEEPAAAESFKSARFLPVPAGVDYVLSADLNGDGKLDLVYVVSPSPSPRSPQVLLGNGDGTFAAAQSVQLPAGNYGTFGKFAIADVNKDGKPDLIVIASNGFSSNIAVLLGNGDGTFQPGIVSAGPTSNTLFPVLEPQMGFADFNEDGAVDIVIADAQNDTLSLLLGDNQGHFTLKNSWPAFNNPHEIYVAEVEVFRGAQRLLAEKRPGILCEIHSEENRRALLTEFARFGYTCKNCGERHLLAFSQ